MASEDRFLGTVLGAAIGDAMGHPTEFLNMEEIRFHYGPKGVSDYSLFWEMDGQRFAPFTDDTQMAECVAQSLIEAAGQDLDATMTVMARRFVQWAENPIGGHRGPGNACLTGCRALSRGVPWAQAGGLEAGGCGSVMRAYPFGLVFAHDPERAETWSVAHSRLTHQHPIALAASAAMAVGISALVREQPLAMVFEAMFDAAARYDLKTVGMMREAHQEAESGAPIDPVMDRLRGWAAHEAIAAGVFLLARFPDDPAAAILAGANTPGDSDSIATLAGALVGARTGIEALPKSWIQNLERTDELQQLALQLSRL